MISGENFQTKRLYLSVKRRPYLDLKTMSISDDEKFPS